MFGQTQQQQGGLFGQQSVQAPVVSYTPQDLAGWRNLDYLVYLNKYTNDGYKVAPWSKFAEGHNQAAALRLMAANGHVSGSFADLIRNNVYEALILADDNTIAKAVVEYDLPSIGVSRFALELAIALYQKEGPITVDDVALVNEVSPKLATTLGQVA